MKELSPVVLQEIVERLIRALQPEKIVLFGSHAYGEPHDASDIDLLVVVAETQEPQHQRASQAYRCLRGLKYLCEIFLALSSAFSQSFQREQVFLYRRIYALVLTAPTEVIVLTHREAERAATVPASLVSQALKRGRVLYG